MRAPQFYETFSWKRGRRRKHDADSLVRQNVLLLDLDAGRHPAPSCPRPPAYSRATSRPRTRRRRTYSPPDDGIANRVGV
jgi:hypothetical protein